MRILITNFYLAGRTGTEIVTAELALGLSARGHEVAVYSPVLGRMAKELRAFGIAALDSVLDVPWTPDVIHGHHNVVVAATMLRFSSTPVVLVSHQPEVWVEGPLNLTGVRRIMAVSEACRERLVIEGGVSPDDVELLLNAVDLDRFLPRSIPLPSKPRRALVLTKSSAHLSAVREAAAISGLELDELGAGTGVVVGDLHARLGGYDVVFATGRMALESLASGCAVVLIDSRGFGGLVTSEVADVWRRHNFGQRLLTERVSVARIVEALKGYDPTDAQNVSAFVRRTASLADYIDRVEAIHRELLGVRVALSSPEDPYVLAPLYERVLKHMAFGRYWTEALSEPSAAERSLKALENSHRSLENSHRSLENSHKSLEHELQGLRSQRDQILASTFWRATSPFRKVLTWLQGFRRHP